MGMLKQQQKFWTVEDYFKHYRNTSCIPVFDGIPQWEMYQPTSRLSIEYKIQTKEQWSRFVINRTRHSVEECRRLCFVNPLCEMALFIHHVNHISLSVINRTSNCIQLPFVCKEKDLIAVTSIDLYIKDGKSNRYQTLKVPLRLQQLMYAHSSC